MTLRGGKPPEAGGPAPPGPHSPHARDCAAAPARATLGALACRLGEQRTPFRDGSCLHGAVRPHDTPLQDTIKIRLEHPPNSTTIVQPPFDEGLFDAALAHYTWGALYHEGLPSKGAKQAYRCAASVW